MEKRLKAIHEGQVRFEKKNGKNVMKENLMNGVDEINIFFRFSRSDLSVISTMVKEIGYYCLIKWNPDAMQEVLIGELEEKGNEVCVIELAQRLVHHLRFEPEDALLLIRHLLS